MRKENVLVIVLICMAVAAVLVYQYSGINKSRFQGIAGGNQQAKDGSKIAWEDMAAGMTRANKEGKPVFLYFYADWCTYCTKLKKTTFKDKDVLAYLADNFVSISVDTDKHRELATQWRVKGLPTMWFLKSDGSKINSIPGYVTAEQMIKFLKYIHTKKYEQVKFHDFVKTL